MPLLTVFDSQADPPDVIALKVRQLTRFDVLEAEGSPAGQVVRNVIDKVRERGDEAL